MTIITVCFKSRQEVSFLPLLSILLFKIYLMIGCGGSLGRTGAFSSCSERGLLFVAVRGLLMRWVPCGAHALGTQASIIVACGL